MAQSYFELGKPSVLQKTLVFSDVKILLIEADLAQADMIRKILYPLGCTQVSSARSAEEADEISLKTIFDIIICNWDLPGVSGVDFCKTLRRNYQSKQQMLPIVLYSTRNQLNDVLAARDSGIHEYIILPFTSKALIERLYMMAEQPRNFLLTNIFVGPDRRRINPIKQLMQKTASVSSKKRTAPLVTSRHSLGHIDIGDKPRMILPDYSLKLKVGLHVPEELQMLSNATELSLDAAKQRMIERLGHEVSALGYHFQSLGEGSFEAAELAPRLINQSAMVIAQESMLVGYDFAMEIAGMLLGFSMQYAHYDDVNHRLIIEKHIEALKVVFSQKLAGDGGVLGDVMLGELSKLIEKFIHI